MPAAENGPLLAAGIRLELKLLISQISNQDCTRGRTIPKRKADPSFYGAIVVGSSNSPTQFYAVVTVRLSTSRMKKRCGGQGESATLSLSGPKYSSEVGINWPP